jgi:ribonuclease HII
MNSKKETAMEVVIKHNAQKNRFEGFVDGKMVSRSRHESYVKDQLAKLGFVVGTVENNVTEKASEFGINERFAFVEQMVSMVAKKTIASAIITGQGGLGKTHTVLKALQTNGMADTTDLAQFEIGARINTPKSYKVIKGFSTAKGLYRTLFEGNGQVLVFDDCDSVLTDPTALNLLKGALDSYGDRWISWNADMRDEDLPRTFKFTGTIIFISNKDLERLDQAVRSRAMCVDLSMTQAQKIERMEVLVADPEFLEEYSKGFKQDAIDFLRENMNSIKNLSLRTLIATTKIRAEGGAWKNLAKYVITQGA